MAKIVVTEELKNKLLKFLENKRSSDLVSTYLFYIESHYKLKPVLFSREKSIYQNTEEVIQHLEKDNKLWHRTEITVGFSDLSVNEETKKIYICPFSGKVFGDNTHANPQDAIYDWVSRCPENKELIGGVRSKRFLVSEDPEVISRYVQKEKKWDNKKKEVFSSALNGKLFISKQAVIKDFKKNYLRPMNLVEVQSQNRFQIEEHFLEFIQENLEESKISEFVQALAEIEEFLPYVEQWLEAGEEEEEEVELEEEAEVKE